MTEPVLIVETKGQVDWLTLNRPDQLNSLAPELVDALVEYFEGLRRNDNVRIVVLQANGKHFCSGADLSGQGFSEDNRNPKDVWDLQRRIGDIYRAMRRCPQPIIALIHGAACGGGFSLALASDIRIAGESAKMNAAYIKVGFTGCDMGSSYFLPRLVGTSVASELLMTGRFIHAQRALAVNLVSQVVPDDQLSQAANSYIDEMLATSPMGLRLTKEALNYSVDANGLEAAMAMEDRHQSLLAHTDDVVEAGMAFFEQRKPVYKDR